MFRNLISFVVSILLISAVGLSQAAEVRSFDIMGMKLGMSVAEIEAAAVAEGLLEKGRLKAPSFEQEVLIVQKKSVTAESYAGLRKLKFASGVAHVEVDFVSTPQGSRAYMIHYVSIDPDRSSEDMSVDVKARYGPPYKTTDRKWVWGDTAALPLRTAPSLEYKIRPLTTLSGQDAVGIFTLRDPRLPKQSMTAIEDAAS